MSELARLRKTNEDLSAIVIALTARLEAERERAVKAEEERDAETKRADLMYENIQTQQRHIDAATVRAEKAEERCEAYKGQVEAWAKEIEALKADMERLHDSLNAAEEERDRLREALFDLASWFDGGPTTHGPWIIKSGEFGADDAVNSARAALKTGEPSHD
jgi:chromosome segregation ATPase